METNKTRSFKPCHRSQIVWGLSEQLFFLLAVCVVFALSSEVGASSIPTNLNFVAWGDSIPQGSLTQYRSLAQSSHGVLLGVRHNGTVETILPRGQTVSLAIPLLSNVREVAVGDGLAVLFNDGRVLFTDALTNELSDRNLVNLPWSIANGAMVSAVDQHGLVLTTDGRVFGSGYQNNGECLPPDAANHARQIATSASYSAALRPDGKLVGWGFPSHGVQYYQKLPTNILDFALTVDTTLVLTTDHNLIAVDHLHPEPFQVATNVQQISASLPTCLILLGDGSVLSTHPFLPPPTWLKDVRSVFAASQTFIAFVDYPLIKLPDGTAWHGDQRAQVGSSLVLEGTFPQDPQAGFQWQKDGTSINGATNATLVFDSLTIADSGVYTVLVNGRVSSPETRLAVGLPAITRQPAGVILQERLPITLQTEATSETPLSYLWLINGQPLSEWNQQTSAFPPGTLPDGPNFTFPPTQVSMSGDYQVVVSNDAGSVTSAVARVTIELGPQLGPDQQDWGAWVFLRDVDHRWRIAQSFQLPTSGRLARLEVPGQIPDGAVLDWVRVDIVEVTTDLENAVVLGTTRLVNHFGQLSGNFDADEIYLDAGKVYAFLLDTESPDSLFTGYGFHTSGGDRYAGGRLSVQKSPGGVWEPSEDDLVFSVLSWPGVPPVRVEPISEDDRMSLGATKTFKVTLSSELQQVASVSWVVDSEVVAVRTSPPYSFEWTGLSAGVYEVIARVQKTDGTSVESRPRVVTVLRVRPSNDDFQERFPLAGFTADVPFALQGATVEPKEPSDLAPALEGSVWWSWTAPKSSWVRLRAESASGVEPLLGVWRGSSLPSLLAITNRAGGVEFEVTSNQVYLISISGPTLEPVNGRLLLAMSGVELVNPPNDAVFTAPARFTASAQRTISSLTITNIDFVVDGVIVGFKRGSSASLSMQINEPGPHRLYTLSTDATGLVAKSREVTITVRPQNDSFANAILVQGREFTTNASIVSATLQDGEPRLGSNEGGHSVWYRWLCPLDGICRLSGESPQGFGIMLNAFQGQSLDTLAWVGANVVNAIVSQSVFPVKRGTTYFIRVDSQWGQEGQVNWGLAIHPTDDLFDYRAKHVGSPLSVLLPNEALSVEDFETGLFSTEVKQTAWFQWRAKLSGPVHVKASAGSSPLGIGVYQGERLPWLQPMGITPAFGPDPSLHFQATAEQQYEIAIFSSALNLQQPIQVEMIQEGLRFVSPLPGSYHPLGKAISIQVALDESDAVLTNVTYLVNGTPVSEGGASFLQEWSPSQAGQYRLVALGMSDTGVSFRSLPLDIVIHDQSEIPKPRLFASPNSAAWCYANALGSVSILGAQPHWFDLTFRPDSDVPANVGYHPDVPGWEDMIAELGLPAATSAERNLIWALGSNGQIYRNGRDAVALPSGTTRWVKVVPGFGSVYFMADDGSAYERGTNKISLQPEGLRWTAVAPAYLGTYALAEDGRFFVTTTGNFGQPVVHQVMPRTGVTRWVEFRSSAAEAILRGDDDQLYRAGVVVGAFDPTQNPARQGVRIPLPSGVGRFVSFDAGGSHFIALGDDGQAYTWGSNSGGQLGVGPFINSTDTPQAVLLPPGVTNWLAVAAGADHSIALGSDCSLYVWGYSAARTLGSQNPIGPLYTPALVLNTGSQCGEPAVFLEGQGALLADGAVRLTIPTIQGRRYQVQYSNNLQDWQNAQPVVFGNGSTIDWVDDGPPKTVVHPGLSPQRHYRVLFAP